MRQIMSDVGDDGSTPRDVHHVAYFDNKKDAKEFVKYVQSHGFRVEKSPEHDAVKFTHVAPVARPTFDEVVNTLKEKVFEFNGQYDGWGCSIIMA